MDGTTREPFAPSAAHDAFPVGVGGSALASDIDPDTGLPVWSATRLATLQCKLNQRLGPEYLSQRPGPGGGPKLTYIEGWKVVDLANEVFGFNGWSTSVTSLDIDYVRARSNAARRAPRVRTVQLRRKRNRAHHASRRHVPRGRWLWPHRGRSGQARGARKGTSARPHLRCSARRRPSPTQLSADSRRLGVCLGMYA